MLIKSALLDRSAEGSLLCPEQNQMQDESKVCVCRRTRIGIMLVVGLVMEVSQIDAHNDATIDYETWGWTKLPPQNQSLTLYGA